MSNEEAIFSFSTSGNLIYRELDSNDYIEEINTPSNT
jgi:hypothetical protein